MNAIIIQITTSGFGDSVQTYEEIFLNAVLLWGSFARETDCPPIGVIQKN